MTSDEWVEVARRINANWPHQQVPDAALAKWWADLRDIPADQVMAAVEAYYRDGREFPPNGGMLRKRVFELAVDAPEFGDAWAAVLKAVRKYGYTQQPGAMRWLSSQHALYPMLAQRVGWRDVCMSEEPDVIRGQARRIWEGLVAQTQRDLTLRGLPASGLAALERVNSPEYRELVAQTLRQMPQLGRAE